MADVDSWYRYRKLSVRPHPDYVLCVDNDMFVMLVRNRDGEYRDPANAYERLNLSSYFLIAIEDLFAIGDVWYPPGMAPYEADEDQ